MKKKPKRYDEKKNRNIKKESEERPSVSGDSLLNRIGPFTRVRKTKRTMKRVKLPYGGCRRERYAEV